MSNVPSGNGNHVKALQKKAIKSERQFLGKSCDNVHIMRELEGKEEKHEPAIIFYEKKDEVLIDCAKASEATDEHLKKIKHDGKEKKIEVRNRSVMQAMDNARNVFNQSES